jgi:MoxR-like ATPase
VKPSRVKAVLAKLIQTPWAVFIWGPPGAGKSSLVREVANDAGLPVIDVRATLLDPTDIRGIPAVQNGQAVWYPPSFLPTEDQSAGLLFLDELTTAPPLVQASLYQLTLDRRVGEYRLPDGWFIVAAGNRAQDSSIVHRMPAACARSSRRCFGSARFVRSC